MILLQGIRYFADRNAGECRKTELDGPFRTVHIPVNATLNGQFYLGTSSISGGGILVESWSGNVTEGKNKHCWRAGVTQPVVAEG